jgi:NAD(P)-dependent dehydrogenase (short-subunit alcohol dehydrogenase family)
MIENAMSEKIAIVTGASGGIGLCTVRRFLQEGWKVVALDRKIENLRQEFASSGEKIVPWELDLDSLNAIEKFCTEVVERVGAPRVLVNNAAVWYYAESTAQSDEQWRHSLQVNVVAPAVLARGLIPCMLTVPGASIVNVASRNAVSSSPCSSAYDASKAALAALTRTLAVEFGPQGLRANAVCPGVIDTPANHTEIGDPEWSANYKRLIPLDRFGRPDEIANVIHFLASDEASFLTGQCLVVDGGQISGQNYSRIFSPSS